MGKLERIVADLEALPADVREDIMEVVESLIAEHGRTTSLLTEAQAAEVQRRLADPDNTIVPDEEMEEFFSQFRR